MSTPEVAKSALRHRLSAARRAVPPEVRQTEAAALAAAPLDPCFDPASRSQDQYFDPAGLPGTVCAYWPVGSEPGSPALLDGLLRRGCRVLLPVLGPDVPGPDVFGAVGPLDWAEYTGAGSMRAGPLGLREPNGPRLGCSAIAEAVLVLVPALAVDHRGVRLGRGGGHYDRTLPLATPSTPLVAVVRDEEVVPLLPAEPHDVLVNAALTPAGGLLALPR